MFAEIVAIGSELTSGAKLDTNSQWLSQRLAEVGIPVHFHTTVADETGQLVEVLRSAAERTDVVLVTGGLGPTLDDLTRQAFAELISVDLVLDKDSLAHIEQLFAGRGRVMPERNRIQAMFPSGSQPVENPRGSAPGIRMQVPRQTRDGETLMVALPGVPSEMKPMFLNSILPLLSGSGRVIKMARINCFGAGESRVEEMLGDLTARGRIPEVGITAHEATITMRIRAEGATADECNRQISAASASIREKLGDLVFGTEDEKLEHVLHRVLIDRGATVSVAEVATNGLLALRLASVDAGQVFAGGVTASSLSSLAQLLTPIDPVPEGPIVDAARACIKHFGSTFGLAVGEINASPTGSGRLAEIALATGSDFERREITLAGNPAIHESLIAKAAKNLIRRYLIGTLDSGV